MARLKSNDKRNAIMEAAVLVIASQGLSAPTATIAKEAGISSGSLFTYFNTKSDLFNHLYIELKTGIIMAALKGFPEKADLRKQLYHVWSNWMNYAATNPDKRRAMAVLSVSEELMPETRAAVGKVIAPLAALIEKIRADGSMSKAPPNITGAIMTALFEATMDTMIGDPDNAKKHCKAGFEAFWRVLN